MENIESTIVNTKVKDLKKKINDVESMKINPVTTVILGKDDDEEDNDDYEENDMNIPDNNPINISENINEDNSDNIDENIADNIVDNDLANIQSIKEEVNVKIEKNKEKEELISRYLEGFDDELTKNSSNENKSSIDDIPNLIDDEIDIPIKENIKKEENKDKHSKDKIRTEKDK